MGPGRCRWSVVIPAFDEAERLPAQLGHVLAYWDRRGEPFELVVVDDGSRDATAERARRAAGAHPAVRILALAAHRGKGFAVREGMLRTRGTLRLMADADGATPIAEVERLEAAIAAGADLAVGFRVPDGAVARGPRSPRGRLAGTAFNLVARVAGVRGVRDTQCGFKLFRGPVAEDLFEALETEGYGFDVELLLLARRRGYRVVEVPVAWNADAGFRAGALADGPRMLADVARARWRLGRWPAGSPARRSP